MDELSLKCLLYADDQIIVAASAYGLQEMVNKMNDSVKKRDMKTLIPSRPRTSTRGTLVQRTHYNDYYHHNDLNGNSRCHHHNNLDGFVVTAPMLSCAQRTELVVLFDLSH
ncbi:hypothetical protein EVAR_38870_1 [Eumeta japonica]|uniref:Reverse transcriptase domain-containing protein n=1 Tax=Eumeta variegata TaxID=151549 RepID=A0A4C1X4J1_EUMVA|nr:hypothetical protein EVAR_38870_1 [Eumeta japonica]